jgi:hypothetical protein
MSVGLQDSEEFQSFKIASSPPDITQVSLKSTRALIA